MKTIIIDEKKWRCGKEGKNSRGKGETLLRNEEGYQCCLGFACQQLGYRGKITGYTEPSYLPVTIKGLSIKDSDYGYIGNSEFAFQAIKINDDATLTHSQRKKKLVALGKKHNFLFKFV